MNQRPTPEAERLLNNPAGVLRASGARPRAATDTAALVPDHLVQVPIGAAALDGDLEVPRGARGAVLFAHGSGSSRHSPRNRFVAAVLNEAGLATLLIDLLTPQEVRGRIRVCRFPLGRGCGEMAHAHHIWIRLNTALVHFDITPRSTKAAMNLLARPGGDLRRPNLDV